MKDEKAREYIGKEIRKGFSESMEFDTVFEREVYRSLAERVFARYLDVAANSKNSFEVEACEKPFRWECDGSVFTGRIDRIDRLDDGAYEVIDYKTGKGADMEFKLCRMMRDGENYQLPIYYFAAREGLKINVGKLSIYWLRKDLDRDRARIKAEVILGEEYKFRESISSTDALKEAAGRIREAVKEIRRGSYPQKARKKWECKRCDYKFLCDGEQ